MRGEMADPPATSPSSDPLGARIDELEIRTEFNARTVEDLDEVVREFAHRVERLERELRDLRAQLEGIVSTPPPDDAPLE
jgi:uncharacterized coiled-coil protein SlyX